MSCPRALFQTRGPATVKARRWLPTGECLTGGHSQRLARGTMTLNNAVACDDTSFSPNVVYNRR